MSSQKRNRLSQVKGVLKSDGVAGVYQKIRDGDHSPLEAITVHNPMSPTHYSDWIKKVEPELRETLTIEPGLALPKLSILVPVYRPNMQHFREAIESVFEQDYANWQLCLHDDGSQSELLTEYLSALESRDSRVNVSSSETNLGISEASNQAAELVAGDYVVLLDQDDRLASNALTELTRAILDNPEVGLIYSDEDKLENGKRTTPFFKPDFNYQLLLSQNYICHIVAIKQAVFDAVNGFRVGFEGAQDHDLILRVIEAIKPGQIHHIPKILYHWRMHEQSTATDLATKPEALGAGQSAIQDHLDRAKTPGKVEQREIRYKVSYDHSNESVTIIIPTRNGVTTLARCVDSILEKTTYPQFEILIVDNGSDDFETLNYLKSLSAKGLQVIVANQPFNFPALNNLAVAQSQSEFICLLNDDTEVISPEWLTELVGHGSQAGVGCVGAKLRYPDDTIQHAGVILGIGGVAGHSHKHFSKDHDGYFSRLQVSQNLSAVTAACMLTRKSLWQEIGGMEERLAVAFNDIDFCLRLSQAGYSVVWTPWAELYHHESVSRGYETTPEKQERFRQEVEYMMNRWSEQLARDPHYNPHLTLKNESFMLRHPAEYLN